MSLFSKRPPKVYYRSMTVGESSTVAEGRFAALPWSMDDFWIAAQLDRPIRCNVNGRWITFRFVSMVSEDDELFGLGGWTAQDEESLMRSRKL